MCAVCVLLDVEHSLVVKLTVSVLVQGKVPARVGVEFRDTGSGIGVDDGNFVDHGCSSSYYCYSSFGLVFAILSIMQPLFLAPSVEFEKTAAMTQLSEDPNAWTHEVLQELYK